MKKAGQGYTYDEADMTYDGATDPKGGQEVRYDASGVAPIITNLSKSSLA